MWVCLCKGVTDRTIREAVENGARTTFDIALACRAGTGCGGCLPEVRKIVWATLDTQTDDLEGAPLPCRAQTYASTV